MILLADTNPERMKTLHSWLSPYYRTRLARTADEAMRMALELHPGLILTDDNLLNEQGQDLLELVRRNPATNLVPVILISSEIASPAPHEDFENGADDALIEPFTQNEMLARVRTQLRMTQVRDRLVRQREGLRLRDEFLQVASHELKTPVASLQLQLQLLKRQAKRVGERVVPMDTFIHELDGALKQTSVLTHLINDLLEVSRIQSGQLAIEPHLEPLSTLVREVISRYAELIHEAGCNFSLEIQEPIFARIDAARIEQVLVNLISNSCKYAPRSHIHISLTERDGTVEMRFTDDGPGIPQAHFDAIFERFSRGSAGKNVSGLGLGLYIIKGIVEAHLGTVKLESTKGQGTEFTIRLPSAPQEDRSVSI